MPKVSSRSAGATYLDKEERIEQLRKAAARARKCIPEIKRVILFGSLATGIPSPRSDADLLIVVESSPHRYSRDRLPEALRALSPLPCAIDLHVLTVEEVDRFQREGSPLLRVALTTGHDLLSAD
jgi:predicted nucleotidyltransferase